MSNPMIAAGKRRPSSAQGRSPGIAVTHESSAPTRRDASPSSEPSPDFAPVGLTNVIVSKPRDAPWAFESRPFGPAMPEWFRLDHDTGKLFLGRSLTRQHSRARQFTALSHALRASPSNLFTFCPYIINLREQRSPQHTACERLPPRKRAVTFFRPRKRFGLVWSSLAADFVAVTRVWAWGSPQELTSLFRPGMRTKGSFACAAAFHAAKRQPNIARRRLRRQSSTSLRQLAWAYPLRPDAPANDSFARAASFNAAVVYLLRAA
jgi:hypothetical protein